jgi:hypothetical protein
VEWEGEAVKAAEKGARVVIARFGIILGERGGPLSQMIRLFEKYVGGPIGSGKQWFSWIHIDDLARAFEFVLEHPEISGPVNMCSPHPEKLAALLAGAVDRVLIDRMNYMPAVRAFYAAHGLLDALTDSFFRTQSTRLAKALRVRGIRVEIVF